MAEERRQRRPLHPWVVAGGEEAVDAYDVVAVGEEPGRQPMADEAGRAGDDDPHR
jgi:hypothetical protein